MVCTWYYSEKCGEDFAAICGVKNCVGVASDLGSFIPMYLEAK